MDIELFRQFGQRVLALDSGQSHVRLYAGLWSASSHNRRGARPEPRARPVNLRKHPLSRRLARLRRRRGASANTRKQKKSCERGVATKALHNAGQFALFLYDGISITRQQTKVTSLSPCRDGIV